MKSYLDIVERILSKGEKKSNRTGIDTLVVPFVHWEHNLDDGFPLLTTKQMGLKNIGVELEGFIKGITSKKWFQDRGCNIWDEWANPETVNEAIEDCKTKTKELKCENLVRKEIQKILDDLGPIYGYQWRSFNQQYGSVKYRYDGAHENGVYEGFDQLQSIVETLKRNPDDRRMVCSTWNPNQLNMQALPPCHLLWNLVHINGKLHLHWHQRSCDLMLGVPFNIASYALLLLLLCKESGLKPGKISALFADCHIYENHIEGAKKQLARKPYSLPKVYITEGNKEQFNIFEWEHTDFVLENYEKHGKIKFEVAV